MAHLSSLLAHILGAGALVPQWLQDHLLPRTKLGLLNSWRRVGLSAVEGKPKSLFQKHPLPFLLWIDHGSGMHWVART